ncbi:MAG TPA: chorismate synthase, partial [Spirochaetota bacterium]|nr:chorismate synthase [Spirochaetota bacterium]
MKLLIRTELNSGGMTRGRMRIVITGAKHSGKSTAAETLSAMLGVPFIDTDNIIVSLYEERTKKKLSVREIFLAIGDDAFRALERDAVKRSMESDFAVIATGGGVILSGENRALLAGSVIAYLRVPEELLWERIEANGIPPFYQGSDGREKHRARVALIDEIMTPRADIIVTVDRGNQNDVAEMLFERSAEFMGQIMRSPSSFGEVIRVQTFGESHGVALGAVLDGVPPGIEITEDYIQKELNRRRPGQSAVATPRDEKDRVRILSGVFEGKSTGHPICMVVYNEDQDSSKYENLRDLFRPGHADFTLWKKYGIRDHRGGGRSSGRETIGRVAPGAIARKILADRGVTIAAFAEEIGGVRGTKEDFSVIESNPVRAADADAAVLMEKAILAAKENHDSLGGVVKLVIRGVPAGLGDPVFFKLDARLAHALVSLGAVKGVEFGSGFLAARLRGSEQNDPMSGRGFESNNAGGILGGISNGDEIIIRIAV